MNKKEFYRLVKIAGFASFIPFVLLAGPLGGYFFGIYLEKSFPKIPLTLILTIVGLIAGIFEAVRIIRLMIKTEK